MSSIFVEKDALRTDRHIDYFKQDHGAGLERLRNILITYALYNPMLGYVQGMSDLLSPIAAIIENEADAFWCFVGLMRGMQLNFQHDQRGMHAQLTSLAHLVGIVDPVLFRKFGRSHLSNFRQRILVFRKFLLSLTSFLFDDNPIGANDCLNFFFCFRWFLILFKREYHFEEIPILWDAILSCPFTRHFDIFIACSMLLLQRQRILQETTALDDMLSLMHKLSGHFDVFKTIDTAEYLYEYFKSLPLTSIPHELHYIAKEIV
jgi:TBC1 domain family member 15